MIPPAHRFAVAGFAVAGALLFAVPAQVHAGKDEIAIQGRLVNDSGDPLPGTRAYRVTFFSSTKGAVYQATGDVEVSPDGVFSIPVPVTPVTLSIEPDQYNLNIDTAVPPDGSWSEPEDQFSGPAEIFSVLYAQTVVQQGSGSGLDADTVDGIEAADLLQSGDVLTEVLAGDGSGSTLDADLLDGMDSGEFATDAEVAAAINTAAQNFVQSPAQPPAPVRLRLLPSSQGSDYRRLTWDLPGNPGVVNYRVYEVPVSPFEITTRGTSFDLTNIAKVTSTSTNELHVRIPYDSGARTWYVAAVNIEGEEGSLSNPYSLNTEQNVFFLLEDTATNDTDIMRVSPVAGSLPEILNVAPGPDSSVDAFAVAPDQNSLIFQANIDDLTEPWLYGIPLDVDAPLPVFRGGTTPITLPLNPGESLVDFGYSADARYVWYLTVGGTGSNIYTFDLRNGGPAVNLTGANEYAAITSVSVSPDARNLFFVNSANALVIKGGVVAQDGIYRVAIPGGNPQRLNLSLPPTSIPLGVSIGPDARSLVVVAGEELAPPKGLGGGLTSYMAYLGVSDVQSFPYMQNAEWSAFTPQFYGVSLRRRVSAKGPIAGGSPINFTSYGSILRSVPVPESTSIRATDLSPDGRFVAYRADSDTRGGTIGAPGGIYLSPAGSVGQPILLVQTESGISINKDGAGDDDEKGLVMISQSSSFAFTPDSRWLGALVQNTPIIKLAIPNTSLTLASIEVPTRPLAIDLLDPNETVTDFVFTQDSRAVVYVALNTTSGDEALYVNSVPPSPASTRITDFVPNNFEGAVVPYLGWSVPEIRSGGLMN